MGNLIFIILFMTISIEVVASRGPITSGGGLGVLCIDEQGQETYEMLDYYETRMKYGEGALLIKTGDWIEDSYNLSRNNYRLQSVEDFDKVIEGFDVVKHNIDSLMANVEWVEEMPFRDDSGSDTDLPVNCKKIQIATYFDHEKKLKINKYYWSRLDSLNKAILFDHEVRYIYERKESEYTSETTRAYIEQVLTASVQVPVLENIDEASLVCKSLENKNTPFRNYEFYFYVHKLHNKTVFQFKNFDNRGLLIKTTATFAINFDIAEVLEPALGKLAVPMYKNINYELKSPVEGNPVVPQEVKLNFISGEPVTIQSFKNGITTSRKLKLSCSKN